MLYKSPNIDFKEIQQKILPDLNTYS